MGKYRRVLEVMAFPIQTGRCGMISMELLPELSGEERIETHFFEVANPRKDSVAHRHLHIRAAMRAATTVRASSASSLDLRCIAGRLTTQPIHDTSSSLLIYCSILSAAVRMRIMSSSICRHWTATRSVPSIPPHGLDLHERTVEIMVDYIGSVPTPSTSFLHAIATPSD